jgi:hypothetical protein
MFTANFGNLLQKLRQLGDIRRDPSRLVLAEQSCLRAQSFVSLKILDVRPEPILGWS